MDQPEVRAAQECNGLKTADANYAKVNGQTRVCNVGCVVPLCGSCLLPGGSRGKSGRPGQSRDGPRPTRAPLRRMERRADAPAGARSEIRFSIHQRFPVEHQERAERTTRELEQILGTVDIDFGALVGRKGLYFHATALWQAGGNLGTYLGLLTGPSGMASANTWRLDSWWLEKRWLDKRSSARVGQFVGQDFYGAQHYAASHPRTDGPRAGKSIYDPRSFRPLPRRRRWKSASCPCTTSTFKSMVLAAVRTPFSQNPTGLVPQFNGTPVSVFGDRVYTG